MLFAVKAQNAVLREFYTEREVVREERRRSYESSPDGMLYENLIAAAFTVHPRITSYNVCYTKLLRSPTRVMTMFTGA